VAQGSHGIPRIVQRNPIHLGIRDYFRRFVISFLIVIILSAISSHPSVTRDAGRSKPNQIKLNEP
jgi:hypothetical protein